MRHPKIPEYLIDLIDSNDSGFLLTDDINQLEEEIYNNCIYISIASDKLVDIASTDIQTFTADLKADRKRKLFMSNFPVNLIYYIWFDEMAGQLRLNFINSNHHKLPFSAQLVFVDTEKEIIDDFLQCDMFRSQIDETSQAIEMDKQPDEKFR